MKAIWFTGILALMTAAQASAHQTFEEDCKNFYPKDRPFYTANYAPPAHFIDGRLTLRFVSYNVDYLASPEAVVKDLTTIEELRNADFILLQEATGDPSGAANGVDAIARALNMNYVFAPGIVAYWLDPQRDYGNAVLSRWPIVAATKVLLPESSKEKCNLRTALGAAVQIGDAHLQVFSVHLSTQFSDSFGGERSRAEQMAPAVEAINSLPNVPAFIAGDLNTVNPWGLEKLEKLMTDNRFVDAHTAGDATNRKHDVVLDHAYARGMSVLGNGTCQQAAASDHYPIWSVVSLE